MQVIKGKVEAIISLSKSTCYFLKTGKCSLNVVKDFYLSFPEQVNAEDLLYCPRLYYAMCRQDKYKSAIVKPCECGHAEVVSGHQRVCIASQKNLPLMLAASHPELIEDACSVCEGKITVNDNNGGKRIVSLHAMVRKD